jgi:hypothetical protein
VKNDRNENMIRRYLLGELSETEQTAFEEELLEDRDKFDRVWTIENELIDSYVRDEMSDADRRLFERHYLSSPLHRKRVEVAESFLSEIDRTMGESVEARERKPAVPWWRKLLNSQSRLRPAFGGVLVMAFLLIFGVIWLYLESVRLTGEIARLENETKAERASLRQRELELANRNRELEKEIAGERGRLERIKDEMEQLRRQPPSPSAIPSFLLMPAPERSEEGRPPLTIPDLAGRVRLLMALEITGYTNYQVRIQSVEGRDLLSRPAGKVLFGKARPFAALTVETANLPKGDYVLILYGQTGRGGKEEINRYFFGVS